MGIRDYFKSKKRERAASAPEPLRPEEIKRKTPRKLLEERIVELQGVGRDIVMRLSQSGNEIGSAIPIDSIEAANVKSTIEERHGGGNFKAWFLMDGGGLTYPGTSDLELYTFTLAGQPKDKKSTTEKKEKRSTLEQVLAEKAASFFTPDGMKALSELFGGGDKSGLEGIKLGFEMAGGGQSQFDAMKSMFTAFQEMAGLMKPPPVTTGGGGGALESIARGLVSGGGVIDKMADAVLTRSTGQPQPGFAGGQPALQQPPAQYPPQPPGTQQPGPPQPEASEADAMPEPLGSFMNYLETLVVNSADMDPLAAWTIRSIDSCITMIPAEMPQQWLRFWQEPEPAVDLLIALVPALRLSSPEYRGEFKQAVLAQHAQEIAAQQQDAQAAAQQQTTEQTDEIQPDDLEIAANEEPEQNADDGRPAEPSEDEGDKANGQEHG